MQRQEIIPAFIQRALFNILALLIHQLNNQSEIVHLIII